MHVLCDLYLWQIDKPSEVYVINQPLEHNVAIGIASTWVDICQGDYALVNSGNIPWSGSDRPNIHNISPNEVLEIARKE